MSDHLEQWAKDSDLNCMCNGIVPVIDSDGNFTGKASLAYEFRWKGHDLIEGYKSLIRHFADSIRQLQRANRTPSAVWTQHRTNSDQIECGEGCPFGYDKIRDMESPDGIGIHYHDLEQYELGE